MYNYGFFAFLKRPKVTELNYLHHIKFQRGTDGQSFNLCMHVVLLCLAVNYGCSIEVKEIENGHFSF